MKKIVLIEDDSDLFALIRYNLEKEGFAFAGSQTGKGALELCRRERPDLIILDIMLPDSDGLDICKGIRAHPELSHVPVIFLTARASETDRIVGLELGANDYIVKPFFVRELIARIKIHFRGQTPTTKILKAGELELDRTRCQVHLAGQDIRADGHRVPAAGVPDEPPGRGVQPRATARRSLGSRPCGHRPHRGRVHSAAAPENRNRGGPGFHPQRARLRLQFQLGSRPWRSSLNRV